MNEDRTTEDLSQMFEYYSERNTGTYMYGNLNEIDTTKIIATENGYKVVDIELEKEHVD